MKHTKGKWEIRANKIFVKDTYKSVAIVTVQDNFDIQKFKAIEDVEQIANAKLIAAAPYLLEALNELVGDLEGEVLSTSINDTIKKAINAINKATL